MQEEMVAVLEINPKISKGGKMICSSLSQM
jgi:hypothetical protein